MAVRVTIQMTPDEFDHVRRFLNERLEGIKERIGEVQVELERLWEQEDPRNDSTIRKLKEEADNLRQDARRAGHLLDDTFK